MGEIGTGHDHRIDVGARDDRFGIAGDIRCPAGIRDAFGARLIPIANHLQYGTWKIVRYDLRMIGPHNSGADHCNTNTHAFFFLGFQKLMGRRRVAVMGFHIAFDIGFQIRHRFASGHQIGDLLTGFLALAEIGGNSATNQHRKMIADGHGVHHLMGDEDDRQTAPLGLVDDAQARGRPA